MMLTLLRCSLPVSFGLHDIRSLSSQLFESLSDNCLLLVLILLNERCTKQNVYHVMQNDSLNLQFLPVVDLVWGAWAGLCVSGRAGLPLPFCSGWSTDVLEPERQTIQGDVTSPPLWPENFIHYPPKMLLSLTLSSCLSLSLCCFCSTFLCMSTRLRIVLSLSIAETGSLAISVDSLSAGLQSTFSTGNSRLTALLKRSKLCKKIMRPSCVNV